RARSSQLKRPATRPTLPAASHRRAGWHGAAARASPRARGVRRGMTSIFRVCPSPIAPAAGSGRPLAGATRVPHSPRREARSDRPVRKIMCVAGARPNFMKVGPVMHALHATPGLQPMLVHTGQHYDPGMNDVFFAELQIPRPDRSLNVGSGSHAVQTAQVMLAIEPVIEEERPDVVVVVGDVNSTLAAALVAVKLGVPVAHVEAGLRSFDRSMPEEINRVLTDQIAALLFTTERSAAANLAREGIAAERIR